MPLPKSIPILIMKKLLFAALMGAAFAMTSCEKEELANQENLTPAAPAVQASSQQIIAALITHTNIRLASDVGIRNQLQVVQNALASVTFPNVGSIRCIMGCIMSKMAANIDCGLDFQEISVDGATFEEIDNLNDCFDLAQSNYQSCLQNCFGN